MIDKSVIVWTLLLAAAGLVLASPMLPDLLYAPWPKRLEAALSVTLLVAFTTALGFIIGLLSKLVRARR